MVLPESSTIAGPCELHAGLELRAVVDRRAVDAFQRVVDVAVALQRGVGLRAGRLALAHGELADFGRGDQMDADHLDRRVEPVGVFALIGLVERRLDLGQAARR